MRDAIVAPEIQAPATPEKLQAFAKLLEEQTIERLKQDGLGCEANILNARTNVVPGKKYTKVDFRSSGRYMVENATGIIYGIKGYGVIHKGHAFGTLDTIQQFYWGEYRAVRKSN